MKKVEIVRCFVGPGPERDGDAAAGEPTVRYVPSDIFHLWRYLMEDAKGFVVEQALTSIWVDEEMYSKEKTAYGAHEVEKVVEVRFFYCRDTDVGRPVIRYFPLAQFDNILGFFIKNFSDEFIKGGMQKTIGFFIETK